MKIRLGLRSPLEVRDPRAATQKVSWNAQDKPMVPTWDAENAIRWGYLANVVVYRATRVIAESLASLPFRVGVDPDRPKDFDRKAPMAVHLSPPPRGPAPNISARTLWAWTCAQWIVTGRFGWEIEQADDGTPAFLWPLVTSRLNPVPSEGGSSYFSRYEYTLTSGEKKSLGLDDVVYAWSPSLEDWRQPESRLQAARLDISVAVMQDRYDYAFLRNDARPAAIIVHEAFAEVEERNRWRQQFLSEHRGVDNAGRPFFSEVEVGDDGNVEGAIDVKQLGITQKDAEFIKRYESKLRNIAMAIGVPFSILDASGRTFSNAGAEWRNFWEMTMLPTAQDLADRVNLSLAPRYGDDLVGWFDFSKVAALRPDRRFTNIVVRDLLDDGVISKDEVREDLGLEPLPDGAGDLPEKKEEPPPPTLIPVATPGLTAEPEDQMTAASGQMETRGVHLEQRRVQMWRSTDRVVRGLEKVWVRRWGQFFARQQRSVISRLNGKRGRRVIETRATADIFDPSFWDTETQEFVSGLYESVVTVAGVRIAERMGLAFDIDAGYAQSFIRSRANQLAGNVTQTTYRAIQQALAEGVALGEDIPSLSKRIREVFSSASQVRARRIARTEVISSFNGGQHEFLMAVGGDLVGGQEWVATADGRVRDSHAEADGQIVAFGQQFQVGGVGLGYPGDPSGPPEEVVNCRCTVAYLTPEEMQ